MKTLRNTLWAAVGLFGLAALVAMPAAADQVILDDLIVDGSACIGLDCVNGESFGFDTLRLKENNLRIKAQDTSSTASFPSRDWQITFNDSSNGGANKFSIDDIDGGRTPFTIEAGAPSHSLFVDDGGRIGLGTSTPVACLHCKDGNTPTLRLEQDGSSGFTPQTWDVAGNEANFFIRDVTNGSTLPIRLRPGAPSSALDIAASGDIGIGTSSPGQALHVVRSGTGNVSVRVENDNTGWDLRSNTVGDFALTAAGSGVNELLLTPTTGNLTIIGGLVTGTAGSCEVATPCDGVFRPDEYTVESIDEHAAYMWTNEHLYGVGPTRAGEPINLTRKTTGILHELEKAHIYIEQLHKRLAKLEAKMAADEAGKSVN